MGVKTSVHGQGDLLEGFPGSHRPKALTGTKNRQIYQALQQAGSIGCTAPELEQHFGWQPGTAGPRLAELKAMGAASKTEARRMGKRIYVVLLP